MTTRMRTLARAYIEELILVGILAALFLALDHYGIVSRQRVAGVLMAVHQLAMDNLKTGVIGWAILPCAPFLLLAFSGDSVRRQILEHTAFVPYIYAYGLTTVVVALTYFATPYLPLASGVLAYGILMFIWLYSAITLFTAARTALTFIQMVQNLHRVDKQLRVGKAP